MGRAVNMKTWLPDLQPMFGIVQKAKSLVLKHPSDLAAMDTSQQMVFSVQATGAVMKATLMVAERRVIHNNPSYLLVSYYSKSSWSRDDSS
jgi:hypothetical protein